MVSPPNLAAPLADVSVGLALVRMVESELGIDPATVFDSVTLSVLKKTQPGDQVAAVMLFEMFERAAKVLKRPDLGVAFAEWVNIRDLGYVALLWDNYSTLAEVLAAAVRYIPVENSALAFRVERHGLEARSVYTVAPEIRHGAAQFMEAALALGVKVIRTLFKPDWRPLGVEMIHPLQSSRRRMYDFFKAPVLPGSSEYALTYSAADLRIRRIAGDNALRSLIEHFLDDRISHKPTDLADEVKRTISWLLRFGSATLDDTASLLAIGPRSLQRRLRASGTDFATLLSEVRTEIVMAYFAKDPNLPIGRLTSLLGYSEPSAVSRFLKQNFGHDGRLLRQTLKNAEA